MEEWKECKLGDICNISSSKRIFAEEYVSSGIPFYRGKEIIEKHNKNAVSSELFITHERFAEIKSKFPVPQIDDILLTSVGTLGIPWLVNESNFYFKDGNLTWFRSNTEKVNPKFLYYWFESNYAKNQIDSMCIGSTQKALTIDTLSKFSINLPPLPTQQKIAAILSSLDDKIELNNKINTNLEQQAGALFKNWFVDFEPFGGKMPEGWKVGKLSEIAEITMGQSPDGKSYNEDGIGSVFYQGRAEFGTRFPTRRLFTTEPKRIAKKFDTLMSVRAPVGDTNIANEDCCIGRGLATIHSKDGHQSFVHYTVLSLRPQLGIFNGEGTVFGCINRDALNNMEIVIPAKTDLDKFEEIVASLDADIYNRSEENDRLKNIRDTLLPKLMNGELEV